MSAVTDPVQAFDPLSDEMMADPYVVMERLRQTGPMVWIEKYQHWVALTFDLVHQIIRDVDRWSSVRASDDGLRRPVRDEIRTLVAGRGVPHVETLTSSDAPDHPHYRAIVSRALSARRIAAMEPRVRQIVDLLIDDFPANGEVDFHEMFARRLPFQVVTEILGVPEADKPALYARGDLGAVGLQAFATPEQREGAVRQSLDLQDYLLSQFHARRKEPRDDLFTAIAVGKFAQERLLDDAELVSLGTQILGGGQHTTVLLLCSMMLLVLSRPEVVEAIKDDAAIAANVVEECMRMEPPVQGLFRLAKVDMEIAGSRVKKGDRVYLLYASANRDEQHFTCPAEFDADRANAKDQLGFGAGVHFCLGAPLARMEGKIALERLLPRLPNLRMHEQKPIAYNKYYFLRGPAQLHLQWDAAPVARTKS